MRTLKEFAAVFADRFPKYDDERYTEILNKFGRYRNSAALKIVSDQKFSNFIELVDDPHGTSNAQLTPTLLEV